MNKLPYYSPALWRQHPNYPKEWQGRVPLLVRMLRTVKLENLGHQNDLQAIIYNEYFVYVEADGTVYACLGPDRAAPLLPAEFQVIKWHAIFPVAQVEQIISRVRDGAPDYEYLLGKRTLLWLHAPSQEKAAEIVLAFTNLPQNSTEALGLATAIGMAVIMRNYLNVNFLLAHLASPPFWASQVLQMEL